MRPRTKMLALTLVALLLAIPAMANQVTLTQGTLTAQITTTATTASITFSDTATEYTSSVAMNLGISGGGSTGTGTASAGVWTFQNGQNSVQCTGTGQWACAVAASNVLINGLTMTFNLNSAPGTTVSLQFNVCSSDNPLCDAGGGQRQHSTNFVTNFSQDGTLVDAPSVPEPASCALFGTGLLAFGGLLRRRLR